MPDLEREFLYRLLNANSGGTSADTLYVGELPPDFPVKLPEGSRIVGATEQKPSASAWTGNLHFQMQDHTRVLLDSPLSVPEFIGQMRSGLDESWESFEWPHMMHHQGFLPAEAQDSLHMSSPALKKSLNVQASDVGGVTQVTLDLNTQSDVDRDRMQMHFLDQWPLTVQVKVPAGATLQPGGGGNSQGHWSSSAVIGCTLSAAELLDYFGQQLIIQGWLPLTQGEALEAIAACWTNSAGNLAFISLSGAGPNYQASIMMVGEQSGDSGSSSSSYTITSND